MTSSSSTVIHLDIVATHDGGRRIVIVQEDGTLTTSSADLKQVSSSQLGGGLTQDNTTILAACCLSPPEAAHSILKSREDVGGLREDSIAVAAFGIESVGSTKRPFYSAWSLQLEASQSLGSLSPRPLFKHDLPGPGLTAAELMQGASVVFGPRASSLLIKSSQGFVRFNLVGTVPTRLPSPESHTTTSFDVLPLNPAYVFLASHTSLQILDVKYGAPQVTLDVTSSKKRKHPGSADVPVAAIQLLAYFSQAQRLVLRIGFNLVAVDASLGKGTSTKQSRTSRLADNIGRGVAPMASGTDKNPLFLKIAEASTQPDTTWSEQTRDLEGMMNQNKIAEFEDSVLRILLADKPSKKQAPIAPAYHDTIVDYLLSKMFSADNQAKPAPSSSPTILRLNLIAPRLVEWLSSAGMLCIWRLKKGLGSQVERHLLDLLQPGDISRALYNADPSSELLLTHIIHNSDHAVEAQIATLKFLIGLAKANSEPPSSELSDPMRAEGPDEIQIDSTSLSPALAQSIVLLMNRLGMLDQNVLSNSLRQSLSLAEITTSIQFLRQQLFQAGHASWLLPYSTNSQKGLTRETGANASSGRKAYLVSFGSIVKMLSACLDTIGPFQLLNSSGPDQMVETIVPELLSEVELSAQYIEDSAELQGILRETIRYADSKELKTSKSFEPKKGPERRGRPVGEILTVYSDQSRDEASGSLAGMLPLSLRDEDVVDPLKVRKGGGRVTERSKRELLMLERRQKGSYSFEKLVL